MISFQTKVEIDGIENTLADIYYQCTQLSDNASDMYLVCQHCFDKLIDFFHFRNMCVESFKKLQAPNFKSEFIDIIESTDSCLNQELKGEKLDKQDCLSITSIQIQEKAECTELVGSLMYVKDDHHNVTTIEDQTLTMDEESVDSDNFELEVN